MIIYDDLEVPAHTEMRSHLKELSQTPHPEGKNTKKHQKNMKKH
jgi:hypothetical protein